MHGKGRQNPGERRLSGTKGEGVGGGWGFRGRKGEGDGRGFRGRGRMALVGTFDLEMADCYWSHWYLKV